ncbi:methionine aminopeptidase 1D, mitochondrial isoform X2 [Zootermopsis nevadensis]|uniref:methionine aminopeptidase 1D, mitochondrial isoform X2 n=1 Tax=Zootermopsis nevadensis TaxID=136037 RepID=UPI000B8EAA5A|nr:methionine aminopeptidase 1D, mitochondrial isoform X2 [Zootermopsis nevadensis]
MCIWKARKVHIRQKLLRDFGFYSVVKPGFVSKGHPVPEHISRPSYFDTFVPSPAPDEAEIKTPAQIKKIRDSCRLAQFILDSVGKYIKVGCTTDDIDAIVHSLTIENNAYPSPLNYRGFPKSVCTSVNNVACHGIPDDRPLEDGDIINVDVTVYLNGYHGDCSAMFLVGEVDKDGQALVKATELSLQRAISICRPGEYFCNIGNEVELVAHKAGFTVVPCFTGHGIGSYFHGPPDIYHCYNNYPGKMEAGMTFTIEPVLAQGSHEIVILEDGWTAVTLDNGRTAQCEHTVLITDDGAEILTDHVT